MKFDLRSKKVVVEALFLVKKKFLTRRLSRL